MGSIGHLAASNVNNFLDEVENGPGGFFRSDENRLLCLEDQIRGYYTALRIHGIQEDIPHLDQDFVQWINYETGWSTCVGWAQAIILFSGAEQGDAQLDVFFRLARRFLSLSRVEVAFAVLSADQVANLIADEKVFAGHGKDSGKVSIMRYGDEPLYYLGVSIGDVHRRVRARGRLDVPLDEIFEWCESKLQISRQGWKYPDEGGL